MIWNTKVRTYYESVMRLLLPVLLMGLTGIESCTTLPPKSTWGKGAGDSVDFRPLNLSGATPECDDIGREREEPCRVRKQFSADAVRRHLRLHQAVWRDNDNLTFAHDDSAANVILAGGLQMPMSPIHGSNLWVATVRIPRLDSAFISYTFILLGGRKGGPAKIDFSIWRGPMALAPAIRAKALHGFVVHDTITSIALHGRRPVSVYMPPSSTQGPAFVVYMGDGQSVDGLAAILDTLIAAGTLPRVMLVGADAADRGAGSGPLADTRSMEYLYNYGSFNGSTDDRFIAHDRFFSNELTSWAEMRWNAPRDCDRRTVFGFSNGGALAIQQGIRHPDIFCHVIAFSPAWQVPDSLPRNSSGMARATFYISGGLLEPSLHRTALQWSTRLSASGFSITLREPVTGHDPNAWSAQLPLALRTTLRP